MVPSHQCLNYQHGNRAYMTQRELLCIRSQREGKLKALQKITREFGINFITINRSALQLGEESSTLKCLVAKQPSLTFTALSTFSLTLCSQTVCFKLLCKGITSSSMECTEWTGDSSKACRTGTASSTWHRPGWLSVQVNRPGTCLQSFSLCSQCLAPEGNNT